MKQISKLFILLISIALISCDQSGTSTSSAKTASADKLDGVGQSNVQDDVSNPNVVQVAISSPDHTTLVEAVKAAGLVDALTNAGPFTVFAPTNEAFNKLPAETIKDLMKPANKAQLSDVLEYHTYVGALNPDYFKDGQEYEQVNGKHVKITVQDDQYFVNGTPILASIKASNGYIHVIGDVLTTAN